MDEKQMKELKKAAEAVAEGLKGTDAGKVILGEDGKLDLNDAARLAEMAKGTPIGKVVLGEDNKLGADDIDRLSGLAKEAVGMLNGVVNQKK